MIEEDIQKRELDERIQHSTAWERCISPPLFSFYVDLISASGAHFTQPFPVPCTSCSDQQNGIPGSLPFSPHPKHTAHQAAIRSLFLKLKSTAFLLCLNFFIDTSGCSDSSSSCSQLLYSGTCFSHSHALRVNLHHHTLHTALFSTVHIPLGGYNSDACPCVLFACLYPVASPCLFFKTIGLGGNPLGSYPGSHIYLGFTFGVMLNVIVWMAKFFFS